MTLLFMFVLLAAQMKECLSIMVLMAVSHKVTGRSEGMKGSD